MNAILELDPGATYTVRSWPGAAVRIVGREQHWEPCLVLTAVAGEEDEWLPALDGEGEWVDADGGRVYVVMVGDDYRHLVDADDLVLLDELEYCAECGQVGCAHDGRERRQA